MLLLALGCGGTSLSAVVADRAVDRQAAPARRGHTQGEDEVGPLEAPIAPSSESEEPDVAVRYEFGVRVPMRDGVTLSAHIYRPAEQVDPLPALFVKTPYMADNYHEYGTYFAKRGYVVALVDARGRGHSDGEFRAFETDGRDGYDVVEWLAAQSWCNGKVGMFGGSYDGFGQWSTLRELPPHLATIVPTASVGFGVDFPLLKNVSYPYTLRWLTFVSGRALNRKVFGDDELWLERYRQYWQGKSSFRDFDRFVGNPSESFQRWAEHPTLDSYYLGVMPGPEQYASIDIPILTITGHYDADQMGAFYYYREHMQHGTAAAKRRHFMLMGPWDHSGTRRPQKQMGGLGFRDASVIDIKELHRQWFDWTLKGTRRPERLTDRFVYYVAETGRWRSAPSLDAATTSHRRLLLASNGQADSVYQSGALGDQSTGDPDSYRRDPLDERLVNFDDVLGAEPGYVDRADGVSVDGASLVYHSQPLAEDVDIVGSPRVTLHLSMDVPDTDIWVRLFEVRPDGRTIFLTEDLMRARYRTSLVEQTLVTSGAIEAYEFPDFFWIARTLRKGSRIRLVVGAPLGAGWQHNYQSGKPIAEETAADARVGTIQLHHDEQHPSVLALPVAPSSGRSAGE